jgi:hypothetical protein
MTRKTNTSFGSGLVATVSRMGASYDMVLRCLECGAEQPCPREQVEAYAQSSFPLHCDKTMELFVVGGEHDASN